MKEIIKEGERYVNVVYDRDKLTEELYGDLTVCEYPKNYAVNIRNRFKASSMHILVANYPIENSLWFCRKTNKNCLKEI